MNRIEQDLAAMKEAIASLADELHQIYSSYLNLLGKAANQQLILASYHVCTQGYPEQFLDLSYNQRHELQQTLRRLAHHTQEELLAQLHPPGALTYQEAVSLPDEFIELDSLISGSSQNLPEIASDAPKKTEITPTHLAQWHQELERAIAQELQTASQAANRLLQKAGILPPKLPEPILEVAAKADAAEIGGRTPNLMNLIIETASNDSSTKENPDDLRDDLRGQAVMHIVAIHLRLVEVEFSDAAITAARTQIRGLLARLQTLGREYHKKERERAIAEAQSAWRASWSEDLEGGKQ